MRRRGESTNKFQAHLTIVIGLCTIIFIGYQFLNAVRPFFGWSLGIVLMLLFVCAIILAANLIAERKNTTVAIFLYVFAVLVTGYTNFDGFYRREAGALVKKDVEVLRSFLADLKNKSDQLFTEKNEIINRLATSLSNQILENRGWGPNADDLKP